MNISISTHLQLMMRVMAKHFLKRSILAGVFLVSTVLCIYSLSLLNGSAVDKNTQHLGVQRSKLFDLNYNQYSSTGKAGTQRPYDGYYGDGYNVRNIPPNLFKLAPEVFDAIPETFLPSFKNPCFFYRGVVPSGLRCLPYFYLIGMQKCGSTDLWEKINAHREIQHNDKEPHWWARYRVRELPPDYSFNVTTPLSLSWYLNVMSYRIVPKLLNNPIMANWLVVGDGSTSTLWDNAWQQSSNRIDGPEYVIADVIKEVQPNAKFIVVLRNPTDRVYSDYLFFGNEDDQFISKRHFHEIVDEGIRRYQRCTQNRSSRACTYAHGTQSSRLLLGNYAVFLRDWLRIFPRDQILVLRLEDWQSRCTSKLREIYRFLELSPLKRSGLSFICGAEKIRTNAQMKKRVGEMLDETRTLLNNFYSPMNAELSELLNSMKFLWNDVTHLPDVAIEHGQALGSRRFP
nr:carbohydrate sulfotransferase 15-like [Lytechinus pictus]